MDYTPNGFTVNLTSKVRLPDIDYINELAVEKRFSLGRSFKQVPHIIEDLYFLFSKEHADPLSFDIKNYLFTSTYIEDNLLKRPMNHQEAAYYKHTLLFLEGIDYASTIGMTPLDKSLNVMMWLIHLSKKNNARQDTVNDPTGKNVNVENQQDLTDAIKDASEDQSGGKSKDNNDEELSKDITKCVRDHLYDLTPSIANVYGHNRPMDVPINRAILKDIKIKAYLENTKGLETALDVKKERNNDSTERNRLQMENHNQITKTNKADMMKDTFDEKFIKKELIVKEKVKPQTKKQLLYMLLDDSGSMSCLEKQTYVRAVLLNRLESVVDNKSELKFSLYESQRYNHSEVTSIESAQKLFKDISTRRPRGGGTNIAAVLQDVVNEIHNVPGYHDPEIMIVCDGDDYINPKDLDPKGVRINVVLLGTNNDGLKKVAEKTKGFYTAEDLYNRGKRGGF